MAKKLSKYLETIGHEIHDTAYQDEKGVNRPITRDEALARQIWKRALGYDEETINADGLPSHRKFPPDPKAQQFIFERREGKPEAPIEGDDTTLLDNVSEIARNMMNRTAEEVVIDEHTDDTETDSKDSVSRHSSDLDVS